MANQKDIKLLWGRSGNRCSICRIELSESQESANAAYTLGEQAHMIGEKDGAARGRSILSEDERNSYHNLILLCPNHHTEIDKNEVAYPIERLYQLKSVHELWVRETLADSSDPKLLAKQIAVTNIIDSAVKLCVMEHWKAWTQGTLGPDPYWHADMFEQIFEFRQRVEAAIWPVEFEELKRATTTLAVLLHSACQKFIEHAEGGNGLYRVHKFYKGKGGYNENYSRDLAVYSDWIEKCYKLVIQATRAANWFAEIVRRDINPMFFAEKGKFVVVEGPFSDKNMTMRAHVPEFSEDEKRTLPAALRET